MALRLSLALSCLLSSRVLCGEEGTCSVGEEGCKARQEKLYSVAGLLEEVAQIPREEQRINRLKELIKDHPEEPDLLLSLTQHNMAMFERLHPKMRGIGELELVNPSIEIYMRLLRMPADKMTDEKHAEIVDHCITSVLGSSNKTASVMVIQEALERMNSGIAAETYQFYFESLVEEHFFGKEYSEAVNLVEKVKTMFPGPHMSINFISAIILRFNEIENKQPHVVSKDMVKRMKPKNDEEKREIIMYAREMETQLRSLKRVNETDLMFEICSELGLFPSKYQRANMQVEGLRATPVWEVEETGQAAALAKIEEQWTVIRGELRNMTHELEDWEWHENREWETKGLWGQFYFLGNGKTSLDMDGKYCEVAPTFCAAVSTFTAALDCALCEVKIDYVDSGAHIQPHCGPTNAKLRANIPITLAKNAHMKLEGVPSFRQRVADQILQWDEGKFTVWDDSFENELHNESGAAQVLLTIDFKHPDIEPEDDFLDPRLWEISIGEGGAANYQLRTDLMS